MHYHYGSSPLHRYDLTELDEDSKHYYYFRSLPKVRRQEKHLLIS